MPNSWRLSCTGNFPCHWRPCKEMNGIIYGCKLLLLLLPTFLQFYKSLNHQNIAQWFNIICLKRRELPSSNQNVLRQSPTVTSSNFWPLPLLLKRYFLKSSSFCIFLRKKSWTSRLTPPLKQSTLVTYQKIKNKLS